MQRKKKGKKENNLKKKENRVHENISFCTLFETACNSLYLKHLLIN